MKAVVKNGFRKGKFLKVFNITEHRIPNSETFIEYVDKMKKLS